VTHLPAGQVRGCRRTVESASSTDPGRTIRKLSLSRLSFTTRWTGDYPTSSPSVRRHQPRALGLRATCGERWTLELHGPLQRNLYTAVAPAALHFAQACSSALRSDRSFLISKCRYEENPNDPPNCPPTSVLLVLKLKFYTKIFALYSRR
jgi:hypothetical protein